MSDNEGEHLIAFTDTNITYPSYALDYDEVLSIISELNLNTDPVYKNINFPKDYISIRYDWIFEWEREIKLIGKKVKDTKISRAFYKNRIYKEEKGYIFVRL